MSYDEPRFQPPRFECFPREGEILSPNLMTLGKDERTEGTTKLAYYYNQFIKGLHFEDVADDNGVQTQTVMDYLLKALKQGLPLNLLRLVEEASIIPSIDEWNAIQACSHLLCPSDNKDSCYPASLKAVLALLGRNNLSKSETTRMYNLLRLYRICIRRKIGWKFIQTKTYG